MTRRRRALVLVGALVALPAIAWSVLALVAAHRLHASVARWERDVGPVKLPPGRAESDLAAKRVSAAAAKLGLDLEHAGGARPSIPLRAIHDYIDRELRSTDPVQWAPPEVRMWFGAHWEELGDLQRALDDEPHWASFEAGSVSAPLPTLAHLAGMRVLLALSLNSAANGFQDDARRALRASWTWREGLDEQRLLVVRLIDSRVLGEQLATLRRLPEPGPGWADRVECAAAAPVLEGLCGDAWVALAYVDHPRDFFAESLQQRVLASSVLTPFRRLAVADRLDVEREQILAATDRPECWTHAAGVPSQAERRWPRSKWMAPSLMPANADVMQRDAERRLEADLTLRVLRAREAPPWTDVEVVDGSCPGWRWRVEPSLARVRVVFDGDAPLVASADGLPWDATSTTFLR